MSDNYNTDKEDLQWWNKAAVEIGCKTIGWTYKSSAMVEHQVTGQRITIPSWLAKEIISLAEQKAM